MKASFKITEQSLENLKSEEVPDDVLEKLEGIKNQECLGEEEFAGILKTTIGEEQTVRFEALILKYASMKKPSRKFWWVAAAIIVILVALEFTCFSGVKTADLINIWEPNIDYRSGINGMVIHPQVGDHYWSLVDDKIRETQGIHRALDYSHIVELARGPGITAIPEFSLQIRDGRIINPNWANESAWPQISEVNEYIMEIFTSFSGSYSNWADPTLDIQIVLQTDRDRPRPIIRISRIPHDSFQNVINPAKISSILNAHRCRGSAENAGFYFTDEAGTLVATRGFRVEFR